MTPADKQRFAETLAALCEIRGKQLSRQASELYWQTMQSWPIEAFEQAARHLLRTAQWFPTPAEFEALRDAGRLTPTEAWALVRERIHRGTWRRQPGDPDYSPMPPDIERTVTACGGWYRMSQSTNAALDRLERTFVEQYVALETVARVRADCPALVQTPRDALTHRGPTRVQFPSVLERLRADATTQLRVTSEAAG